MSVDVKNAIERLDKLGFSAQVQGTGNEWVLCLHGWLDNSNSFSPMANIKRDNHCWLMIDLVGHGRSKWRDKDAHYYFIDYVYDLIVIINELGIERCHLIGHSLGALICGMFSALYPERVMTLSMIEGIGLMYAEESDIKHQIRQSFNERVQIKNKVKKPFPSLDALVNLRTQVSDFTEMEARLLLSRNIKEEAGKVSLTSDPKLKTHSAFRFSLSQSLNLLSGIKVPSLLVIGNNGYDFVKSNLKTFENCYVHLQIKTIEGGHHCHMENPKACCGLIEAHLNAIHLT